MGEWLCGSETGNVWNGRMRSEVEEDFIRLEETGASIVQGDLKRLRPGKARRSHDQLRASRFIKLQVLRDLSFDHCPLPLTNRAHVDGWRAGHDAELRPVTGQICHPCARD